MTLQLRAKTFLVLTTCLVMLFCLIYLYAFLYQIGSNVKAEWWLKNVYSYKDFIVSSINDRKIIIAAGSNSLFSLNSSVVEEKTGLKVVNLSGHAGLGLDFIFHKIKDHINEGDIVVLPLEYNYYSDDGYSLWEVNNYMAWGWDDYLSHLTLLELLKLISNVPKLRILDGVIKQDDSNPVLDIDTVVSQVENAQSSNNVQKIKYSHLGLNKHGDILVDSLPTNKLLKDYSKGIGYYALTRKPSDEFIEVFKKIKNMVNARKADLIVTWPVTIRNTSYDLSLSKYQEMTTRFKNTMQNHSVHIRCNPALFHMDVDFFFDTKYHTNKSGADIRSINLGTCLKNIINNQDQEDLEYSDANQIILKQQQDDDRLKQSNLYTRVQHLKLIREALDLYHRNNKSYPVSSGFDGLYTKWGESGKDWIKGLSPDYVKILPRDPRNSESPDQQYLYKSNGKAYKLIAHTPEDCNYASLRYPEMIDPRRDCWAYGYWSESAKHW